ncbi:MAG: methionine--tRNA ligase [Bacteroidota bacterium]|nr:methionine--tRNA ligase [Bacteroidota bacterium]
MDSPKRYTITAALPYANGPVHIGHLAGCYLPSDIYARYLRSAGEDVLFVCGSDEHGVAIMLKAQNEGITPQQLVDKYHPIIRDSFKAMGISFDIYSRTTNPVHYETASDFFKTLYDKGVFVEKTSMQFYDLEHKQFLADRYIYGTCPNCRYEKAYGDQCEKCGTSLDPKDLIEPKSVLSHGKPELKETSHWYFPLQNYQKWLEGYILVEHKDWKPNVVGQCRSWLKVEGGLQERSITRDLTWGVPVPLPEAKGKVLYVWMDAPIGYISASKEWAKETGNDWEPYWKSPETSLVHFIGKDNIVFHCIIFPAMLHAHGGFILPDNVPANEFLNIEGEKVSTSRNWAVWVHEYVRDLPGKEDVLRYVLCANAPEAKDNDFLWSDFQAKNNNELAAIFGNLVNRVVILTHKYCDGRVPDAGIGSVAEVELKQAMDAAPEKIAKNIRDFKFREALSEMMNVARLGNKYLTETEPWKIYKTDPERAATVLHYGLQLLANLAILADPFLPFTAQKLRNMLGFHGRKWKDAGRMDLLDPGSPVNQADILFEQIEDSVIEQQVKKLHDSLVPVIPIDAKPMEEEKKAGKAEIQYEDFARLELLAGTITEAEKVPKADKLLKLIVDIGTEKRTVVSGIAMHYAPEDIIGQQVCLVANLAPRALRGITSQGMILMAEDADGKLVFIQPSVKVKEGSGVS